MTFKKIFLLWCLITAGFGGLFYMAKMLIKGHPLWPWALPYLYIGALILFALYVLTLPKK